MGLHRVGLWTSQRYWLLNNPDPVWGQGKAVEISGCLRLHRQLPNGRVPNGRGLLTGIRGFHKGLVVVPRPGSCRMRFVWPSSGLGAEGSGNFEAIFSHQGVVGPASGTPGLITGVDWAEKEGVAFRTEAAGMILAPQDEDLSCASRPPDWRSVPRLHHCLQYLASGSTIPSIPRAFSPLLTCGECPLTGLSLF